MAPGGGKERTYGWTGERAKGRTGERNGGREEGNGGMVKRKMETGSSWDIEEGSNGRTNRWTDEGTDERSLIINVELSKALLREFVCRYWLKFNYIKALFCSLNIIMLTKLFYQTHEDSCQYGDVLCRACGKAIERRMFEDHRTNECVNRVVACAYCGGEVRISNMKVFPYT